MNEPKQCDKVDRAPRDENRDLVAYLYGYANSGEAGSDVLAKVRRAADLLTLFLDGPRSATAPRIGPYEPPMVYDPMRGMVKPGGERQPAWIEEELKDGDRICEAAGVKRTEGGRLPVAKIINALRASSSTAPRFEVGVDGFSDHHKREVRKHWDYLVQKYADMPPRTDTSNAIANVINDAINLAAGIRRYASSAIGERKP